MKDIVNVGPQPKKNRKDWKSVYHVMAGITAEYIFNVMRPRPGDDLSRDLEQFFKYSAKTSKEWVEMLGSDHDSLEELLDAIEFKEDEVSYEEFSSGITFTFGGDGSKIIVGDMTIPFSQKFLKVVEIEGSPYALLYSQVEEPQFKAILGPGPRREYTEKAELVLKECTGIQKNPLGIQIKPVEADMFFDLTDDLRGVDNDQRAAISADLDRNLLVVAGAGSGKTRSLVGRLCYLHLVKGIPLQRIVALTYMRKATHPLVKSASEQLREAYIKIGANTTPDDVNVSTIDAFFKKLIDNYWEDMGFTSKPEFKFDTKDEVKLDIIRSIITDNNYPVHKDIQMSELRRQLENYANGLSVNIPGIENILRSYVEWQMENHQILEFFCSSYIVKLALTEDSMLKERICDAFDCILIDEFQDINRLQNEIFSVLYDSNIHFTLVGDDDQTIYTWRGSDVGIIRDMLKDESVRKVYLTVNYRNNPHIVEAGNSILERMDGRSKKGMRITPYQPTGPKIRQCSVLADYSDLANEIRKMYDPSLDGEKICILSRRSECQEAVQKALHSFNIPSFISKPTSDSDVSPGYKILKSLAFIFCRYNVKANYDTLNELTSGRYTNMELKSFITGAKPFTDRETDYAVKVGDIVALAEYLDVRLHQAFSFEEMVSNYCRAYAEIVEKNPAEDRVVQDICLQLFLDYVSTNDWTYPQIPKDILVTIFTRFERYYLTNTSAYDSNVGNVNSVMISTIHSSKGLEYDVVFVIGMDHGLFPNTKKIDKDYDQCVKDIQNLEKSKRSLDRLRANIGEDTFKTLIDECDPSRLTDADVDDVVELKEELQDIKPDLIGLTANGVEGYHLAYDDYVRPMVDAHRNRIRTLNLEKRSIEERYYQCEEHILAGDDDTSESREALESIGKEIYEVDVKISEAKHDLDSFMESIRHLEFMNGLCNIANQYFADIDHLNHQEQLMASLAKEREEKRQEEMRSFYVSISRARKLLYLCTSFGSGPSDFIGYINEDDREQYRMTTKTEDEMIDLVRTYKGNVGSEAIKRNPDLKKIDDATSQMMDNLSGELKGKCDSYIMNYMRDNPEYRRLNGVAADYFRTALYLDYLGKMLGTDFKNEVLLNLQRSGEELLRSHIREDAQRIMADEEFCVQLNNELYGIVKASSRVGITPDADYLKKVFVLPDKYDGFKRNFKEMALGIYVVKSGRWPEIMVKYSDNWDFDELSMKPEEFIVKALDLCNIRNKTAHNRMDETWKNDQVPYAYGCLKGVLGATTV